MAMKIDLEVLRRIVRDEVRAVVREEMAAPRTAVPMEEDGDIVLKRAREAASRMRAARAGKPPC